MGGPGGRFTVQLAQSTKEYRVFGNDGLPIWPLVRRHIINRRAQTSFELVHSDSFAQFSLNRSPVAEINRNHEPPLFLKNSEWLASHPLSISGISRQPPSPCARGLRRPPTSILHPRPFGSGYAGLRNIWPRDSGVRRHGVRGSLGCASNRRRAGARSSPIPGWAEVRSRVRRSDKHAARMAP
jgi:hypothetical protein